MIIRKYSIGKYAARIYFLTIIDGSKEKSKDTDSVVILFQWSEICKKSNNSDY
jgi:hypothetical protein